MRRGPLITIAILVIVVVAAFVYLGRRGEREGWSENWYPSLRAWWVPPENLENFKAEAIRLGLLELYENGGRWIIPNENMEEFKKILKELIENFGGWVENDDTIFYHDVMTFSFASEPAVDEPVGDWRTQRIIWTVPPENVDEFRKEERTRGFIVEYPDGAVELRIQGRENEFKELLKKYGGCWDNGGFQENENVSAPENENVPPENVDLQYLAEHFSEFENKRVMVTGVVRNLSYAPGDVIVGFYDDVSEEEANALIESYGLTWEPSPFWEISKWGVVKVQVGQELQWIEIFEKESIVRYAQLNYYYIIPEFPIFWIDGVEVIAPMGKIPPSDNSVVTVVGTVKRVGENYVIYAESWTDRDDEDR